MTVYNYFIKMAIGKIYMKNVGTVLIETERLILRRFTTSDSQAMFLNWAGSLKVTKYLAWSYHKSLSESEDLILSWCSRYDEKDFYQWAIVLKENNELIGTIDAEKIPFKKSFETGYCLGEKFWGKGYATESLKAVIDFLFDSTSCKSIIAVSSEENKASLMVLKKSGMSLKNKKEIYIPADKGFLTCRTYEIKKGRRK